LKRKFLSAAVLLAGLLAAGSLWAHHSPSAIFDMSKQFVLTGTLSKVDWLNPHISLFIDAKGADGSTESWKFESNPPSWFKHVGLARADIAKGIDQTVTVEGVRARDGSHYGYMRKITFPDGSSIEMAQGDAAGEEAKQ
jgi:hypothetical protein